MSRLHTLLERILAFSVIILLLAGCSTARRMELKLHRQVYESLGMEEERGDNFELYKEVASWLRTPYRGGGLTHNGADCSGFVYMVYKNVYGKTLERNSEDILKKNCHRIGKGRLKEGDLVFFNTGSRWRSGVNHVGIYLRDNNFVHASSSKGVMVSSLDEDYFQKTWICGGRVNK